MPAKPLPPQDYLLQRLRYEPETGLLFWKRTALMSPQWNGKFSGKRALTAVVSGYHHGNIDNKRHLAHRVIWKMMTGEDPNFIDHIDGNRSNNRWINLRSVSSAENGKNKGLLKSNTSGAMGVTFCKQTGRWRAGMQLNGKHICLGRYDTIEEAKEARERGDKAFGFHKNHGDDRMTGTCRP